MNKIHAGYETVSECDLCGSRACRLIDEKGHIVQCLNCGLKFVNLRPRQKDIAQSYDRSLENLPDWGEVIPEAQMMYESRFNFMERFIKEGRLLDVGAGLGVFLSLAKKTNRWQCSGTDTSKYAGEFSRQRFGIELLLGQLEDLNFADRSFDAVSFWHVLEHLPSPAKAIKEARRILKDGGFLFIAVPNDSWLGRRHFIKNKIRQTLNRLPFKKKLRLKKMYPEISENGNLHLSYFTPSTLAKLLKACGMRIVKQTVDFDYERPDEKLKKRYKRDLFLCNLTGLNFSNAIMVAAQKELSL
ncbi:MAG: class I SAM-dependent methyltransferase [Candidatus Omnitrophica bacterium]|nr:class I SAM-dependent methyltransferase [Candidatus Omnitrophota bacterium]